MKNLNFKPVASIRCAHPLKAFRVGYNPSGKPKYKVTGFDVAALLKKSEDDYVCVSDTRAKYLPKNKLITEYIEIPCNRCVYCRLRYSKNWADRCMLEMQYHKQSWFLTLTYDQAHLPTHEVANNDTGEITTVHSLRLKDFQDFMKRLRKNRPDLRLRYFCAGEYGSTTYRPHMHVIMFGLELQMRKHDALISKESYIFDDVELYRSDVNGNNYYKSDKLNGCWGHGFVVIGRADYSSIAYTARYITKKAYGLQSDAYGDLGLAREFCVMSRRPGIGLQYLEDHPDCVNQSFIHISTKDGGKKFRPPRYFRKKFDEIWENNDPNGYNEKKESDYIETLERQKEIRDLLTQNTDLSYLELLHVQEENKLAGFKGIERSKI